MGSVSGFTGMMCYGDFFSKNSHAGARAHFKLIQLPIIEYYIVYIRLY